MLFLDRVFKKKFFLEISVCTFMYDCHGGVVIVTHLFLCAEMA